MTNQRALQLSLLLGFPIALIGILLSNALSWIDDQTYQELGSLIGYKILLTIVMILLITLSFLLLYYFLIIKEQVGLPKNDLKPFYGLYWDKKGEPFCPVCKTPLRYAPKHVHVSVFSAVHRIFVFERIHYAVQCAQ